MLMALLLQCCSLCYLEKDEYQPHEQNQKILYSAGYNLLYYITFNSVITNRSVLSCVGFHFGRKA